MRRQLYYRSDGTTCHLEWDEDEEEEVEVEMDQTWSQTNYLQALFFFLVLFAIIFA